jgi:hypothetical protein
MRGIVENKYNFFNANLATLSLQVLGASHDQNIYLCKNSATIFLTTYTFIQCLKPGLLSITTAEECVSTNCDQQVLVQIQSQFFYSPRHMNCAIISAAALQHNFLCALRSSIRLKAFSSKQS